MAESWCRTGTSGTLHHLTLMSADCNTVENIHFKGLSENGIKSEEEWMEQRTSSYVFKPFKKNFLTLHLRSSKRLKGC